MKGCEQNHEKQSLLLLMCGHEGASLFWARLEGLGSTEVQYGLKHHIKPETGRPVGSPELYPVPLGASECSVDIGWVV